MWIWILSASLWIRDNAIIFNLGKRCVILIWIFIFYTFHHSTWNFFIWLFCWFCNLRVSSLKTLDNVHIFMFCLDWSIIQKLCTWKRANQSSLLGFFHSSSFGSVLFIHVFWIILLPWGLVSPFKWESLEKPLFWERDCELLTWLLEGEICIGDNFFC